MQPSSTFEFEDFELLLGRRQPDGYPATVVRSPAGEVAGLADFDSLDPQVNEAIDAIAGGAADAAFIDDFGNWLFETLFAGDIAALFRTSLALTRSQGKRLRVRLRVDAPELALLPWECLYDRRERLFLANSPEVALVRHVAMKLPVRPTEVDPPLRLLSFMSSPSDMAAIDVRREHAILAEALTASATAGTIEWHAVEGGQIEQLGEAIRRFQPHIFHFVGHGIFAGETAYLAFEDADGRTRLADELTVRDLFAGADAMRLAVLNACQSATQSTSEPLAGLAPRLLQRSLAAVVAMQFPIGEQAALHFTRAFYSALAAGVPLEVAIVDARKAIQAAPTQSPAAWSTPVLFLRARSGQIFNIKSDTGVRPAIAAPPAPEAPPVLANFIGRQAEIERYRRALDTGGTAVITGMAGVGKTALAAMLAAEYGTHAPIFWHSFHTDEGLESLVWGLAGFLAWHGKGDLWELLQSTAQNRGQPPPPPILLDYVFGALQGTNALLCLDDFHLVEEDPLAGALLDRLRQGTASGTLRLIATSRHAVDLGAPGEAPLEGLSAAEAEHLLAERQLRLAPSEIAQLHAITEGNAELLILAASALRAAGEPGQLLRRLLGSNDIERNLLNEVDRYLDDSQKSVMSGVAVLLGYPGTRDAIEEVLDGANVRRTLAYLHNRNLLLARQGSTDREYSEHAVVQAFYYGLISRRERMAMHRRAGAYYEFEEVDDLRAATHYLHSGDSARAAALATRDAWTYINQGRAQALRSLLTQLPLAPLNPADQVRVLETLGDLNHFLGELPEAGRCYSSAHETCNGADSAAGPLWRKLGEVLMRQGDYAGAADAFEQARAALEGGAHPDHEPAQLSIATGTLLTLTGAFEAAQEVTEAILAGAGAELPPRLTGDVYDLLGKIAFYQGELEQAEQHYLRLLTLREQAGDVRDLLRTYSNLAAVYGEQERSADAMAANRAALALAERIGDVIAAAHIESNLASDYVQQQEFGAALEWLDRAEARYRHMGALAGLQQVGNNRADILLQTGKLDEAAAQAQAALRMADELGEPVARLNSLATLAEIEYQAGRSDAALAACRAARALAGETGVELWPELQHLYEILVAASAVDAAPDGDQ